MSKMNPLENTAQEEEELSYWLAFSQTSGTGLGFRKIKELYERFDDIGEAWKASQRQLKDLHFNQTVIEKFLELRKTIEPMALLEKIKAAKVEAIHFLDCRYPMLLREIFDPPVVLFMKGHVLPEDMTHNVGIVGTRTPTALGQKLAKEISGGLAKSGVTIISGMALGIDSLAHWGALEGNGKTIAVLGCGVDYCYPSSNRHLYQALTEGGNGAVISEFFPGTKPEKWHFPARNRIISGMSSALAVIEAGEISGALITAKMAFEQSREVFAIPGRLTDRMSAGTNDLIAKNMAHLLRDHRDILQEMDWVQARLSTSQPTVVELFGREKEVFELMSAEPVHFDSLSEKTGMNTGELSATLTMLELGGVITRLPGDWYCLEAQVVPVK